MKSNFVKKASFILFGCLSVAIGLYPLIYISFNKEIGILTSKTEELLSYLPWNLAFYCHIFLGGLALLIGWIQFHKKIRNKRIRLHRTIGKIYVVSAVFSSMAGIFIGFFANGGIISKVGFVCLGLIWFISTLLAFDYIRKGDVINHQKMMIFSYAACFAAVMLRLWLPLLIIIFSDFILAYRIVAWLCWVPNLIVASFIVRKFSL